MGVYDGSLGAFQVGTLISIFLLGITATQAWYYFQNFPNDKRVYWWLVMGLLVLDWAHSAISCYTIYDWQVSHFGDPAHLLNAPWSFGVDPVMVGIAAFVCQGFYSYRIYVMSKKNLVVPVFVMILSVVSFGFALGATIQIFRLKLFSAFTTFTYGVVTWLVCAAAADIIITCSLVFYLAKSKAEMTATNGVLNKIIQLTIETNGLTAAVAVIDAVLFATLTTSYHVIPNLCLIKLYFNSLLVSLNARVDLEKQIMTSRHGGFSHQQQLSNTGSPSVTTALGFGRADIDPHYVKSRNLPLDVHIQTTQTTLVSGGDDYSSKSEDFYDMEKGGRNRRTPYASPHLSNASSSPRMPGSARAPEVLILAPMSPREREREEMRSEEGAAF
ncbi:hypothetical protein BCR35DRAFT_309562 [Leucosporidium creatinivorum]|uniref:DUF6534 domain-containing protein n=1 Tax=Leucosporidium creatinivorum TaxID=106004 RepID=A0A1Y2DFP2_9BASI|nr:hypothetical protein BCR35DRAFT_309562 [Leucosporidium creatinivorum]